MPFDANEIFDFWFGRSSDAEFGQSRRAWFAKDPAFDAEIRQRFFSALVAAERGELQAWRDTAQSCLSYIILLDQFPRNMFRDTVRAFATDPMALQAARLAVERKFDQTFAPLQRIFFYLPFEHSESLADQTQSVELVQALADEDAARADFLDYAKRHREVIARFGRFPHRNRILGRASTAAEIEFLQQPGSSF